MIRPPYRPLGFFRLVLAAVVVLGHGAWLAPDDPVAQALASSKAAGSAVLAFFVLSGFVLSEAAASFYRGRPAAFFANRFLKIVPAYLAAFAVSLTAHLVLKGQDLALNGIAFEGYKSLPQQMWTWTNVLYNPLAVVPFLYLDTASHLLGNGLYLFVRYIWAVNVEVLFYATVLAAIVLVSRGWHLADRWIAAAVGSIAVVHIAIGITGNLNFYFAYAPYFMLGALLWHVTRRRNAWTVASLMLLLLPIGMHSATAYTVAGAAILFVFIAALAALTRAPLAAGWRHLDRQFGDLSYSLYLNHFVVLVLFSAYFGDRGTAVWLAAFGASLLLAYVMQLAAERPLDRLRASLRGHALTQEVLPPHLRPKTQSADSAIVR